MARIANINIPDNKRVEIALTYIFGVGRSTALKLVMGSKIDRLKRIKDLTENEMDLLRKTVESELVVEGELSKEIRKNIKSKMDLGSYVGVRHRKGLPVRGQNTHNNARTRKGKVKKVIANKKK